MDRFLFLKEWEHFSGSTLSEEGRRNFLRECSPFMHYGESILMNALRVAKKNGKFDLEYIRKVAEQLYDRERKSASTTSNVDSGSSCTISFSGLSSGIFNVGGGDYYERRERKRWKR